MEMIKGLMGSKKFLAAISVAAVCVAAELGVKISENLIHQLLALVGVYIVGQGVADFGKEKAKIEGEDRKAQLAYQKGEA